MLRRKKKEVEIAVMRNDSWSIEATVPDPEQAQTIAASYLNQPGVTGVRVLKDSTADVSNPKDSDILFEKVKPKGADDRIVVGEIEDAPECTELSEVMSTDGRKTINRLFRSYLDKNNLTATEVMHNFKELKRCMDHDTIMPSAVAKVAGLQARGKQNVSANQRRDQLFGFVNEMADKARKAETAPLPRIVEAGMDQALKIIESNTRGPDFDYMVKVAMSRDLVDNRSWFGKLTQSLEWAKPAEDERALGYLDVFISDTLVNSTVVQDLLGYQKDLGGAILTMADMATGQLDAPEDLESMNPELPEYAAAKLNEMMAGEKLPESHSALIDRIRSQLVSQSSLSRGDEPGDEQARFREIIDRLLPSFDLVGGPEMAEAMLNRQSRMLNKGGISGLKESAGAILPYFDDPMRKTGYLLSLFDTELGKLELADEIGDQFDELLAKPKSISQVIQTKMPPNKMMEKLTSIYYKIGESKLGGERKDRITENLDELLANYIVQSKILEKLDDPTRPLHIRAFMLVSMCQPEMLPRGKAASLARDIIVEHLRQPNFEAELVAQIPDPAQKEETLRRFHEQLNRSGFFG